MKSFAKKLQTVPKALEKGAAASGKAILAEVRRGFVEQKDPHGTPWKPKKKKDGRKILHGKTARLRRGWQVREATRENIALRNDAAHYWRVHQKGTLRIPRRAMVPFRGLPKRWAKAMEDAYLKELGRALK